MGHITPEEFQAIRAIVSAETPHLPRSEQDALTLFFVSLVEEQRTAEQRHQSRRHKPRRRKGRRAT